MTMRRDTQKGRVYRSEHVVMRAMEAAGEIEVLNLIDLREAVAKTWAVMGTGLRTPTVEWLSKRATATGAHYDPQTHTVRFTPNNIVCCQMIVCHELTHGALAGPVIRGEQPWHGPEFVRRYLQTVDRTMPFEVQQSLRRSMAINRVRIAR
jgi:hypothetical protein